MQQNKEIHNKEIRFYKEIIVYMKKNPDIFYKKQNMHVREKKTDINLRFLLYK